MKVSPKHSNLKWPSDIFPVITPASNPAKISTALGEIFCLKSPRSLPCKAPTGHVLSFKAAPSSGSPEASKAKTGTEHPHFLNPLASQDTSLRLLRLCAENSASPAVIKHHYQEHLGEVRVHAAPITRGSQQEYGGRN